MKTILILAFTSACLCFVDLPIDNFMNPTTNLLGGPISYKDINFEVIQQSHIEITPVLNDAAYSSQLQASGCFDASAFESLHFSYKVSHPLATFLFAVEFYDASCTNSDGRLLFDGRKEAYALNGIAMFKVNKFNSLRPGKPESSKRVKSISIIKIAYSDTIDFMYTFADIGFKFGLDTSAPSTSAPPRRRPAPSYEGLEASFGSSSQAAGPSTSAPPRRRPAPSYEGLGASFGSSFSSGPFTSATAKKLPNSVDEQSLESDALLGISPLRFSKG